LANRALLFIQPGFSAVLAVLFPSRINLIIRSVLSPVRVISRNPNRHR
jgi:hypothetical protein